MPGGSSGVVLKDLHILFQVGTAGGLTDGQLIERFLELPIPDNDQVFDCSDDGMWLATQTISGEPRHRGRLAVVHPDGSGSLYLTEGSANDDLYSIFKISPDSQSIAYVAIKTVDDKHEKGVMQP